jgi:hypothetical protein
MSRDVPDLKSQILTILDLYRTKIHLDATTNELLIQKSKPIKALEIRFPKDVSDQAIIRDLESKMIATPAESHHILKNASDSFSAPQEGRRIARSRSTSWSTPYLQLT